MKRALRGACGLLVFVLLIHFSGNLLLGGRLGGYAAAAVQLSARVAAAGDWPQTQPVETSKGVTAPSGATGSVASSVTQGEEADPPVITTELSEAAGAVVTRNISPYTASLHYGNVYVKNSTSKTLDLPALLAADLPVHCTFSDQPEVLIVHTHATETYLYEDRDYYTESDPTRTTDETKNMIRIGEVLAGKLREAGLTVLHDTTQHDAEAYTGSYGRAAKTIQSYLDRYPSIQVVLDIHRDSVSGEGTDKVKAVTQVDGRDAAQMMLVMGCQDGSITDYPNWEQNLRLALRYQQALETAYPGLARALMLSAKKYNQDLTTGSLLIEIGTEVNSLDEAEYTAQLAGQILAQVLKN